jgi:hypothetical protein
VAIFKISGGVKIMQKNLVRTILIFTITLPFTLSFNWHDRAYDILGETDWYLSKQAAASGTPALSSTIGAENQWESYNEWRCFSTKSIDLRCATIDDNSSSLIPVVSVLSKDEDLDYEYALGSEYIWDCQKVIDSWATLVDEQESICLYGARLQAPEQDNISLWYIDQIKTQNGYWKMENYHDFLSDDE